MLDTRPAGCLEDLACVTDISPFITDLLTLSAVRAGRSLQIDCERSLSESSCPHLMSKLKASLKL